MDNLPSNGNALFGSGSNNFTLTYVRNDPFSELFFYFELKASPKKKDHHVQIICNWARRTTTIRTTLPMTRKRKLTTISVLRGGKLSRLDLIRHPSIEENEINDFDIEEDTNEPSMYIEEMSTNVMDKEEDEEENLTTDIMIQSKKKKFKTSTTMPIDSTTIANNNNDDDEWSRIRSIAGIESPSSNDFFSFNNRTLISSVQASILSNEPKSSHKMSKNKLVIMILLISSTTIFLFSLYCLKVKQPTFIQRLRLNTNVALLFCCEAGKFLFSSNKNPQSISNTPPTIHHQKSLPIPTTDYQSSEYYMNHCHTTQSIYDNEGSACGKSMYTIDGDGLDESEYTTRYDQYHGGDTC
jgi:hypothetical protein